MKIVVLSHFSNLELFTSIMLNLRPGAWNVKDGKRVEVVFLTYWRFPQIAAKFVVRLLHHDLILQNWSYLLYMVSCFYATWYGLEKWTQKEWNTLEVLNRALQLTISICLRMISIQTTLRWKAKGHIEVFTRRLRVPQVLQSGSKEGFATPPTYQLAWAATISRYTMSMNWSFCAPLTNMISVSICQFTSTHDQVCDIIFPDMPDISTDGYDIANINILCLRTVDHNQSRHYTTLQRWCRTC